MTMEVAVEIKWIIEDDQSNGYILQLVEAGDAARRILPVVIGAPEAHAIAMELQGVKPYRPFTHDLIVQLLESLNVDINKVVITELNNNTFYASIYLDNSSTGEDYLDARPSDAIALAIRVGAPIFVTEEVMDVASFEMDSKEAQQGGGTQIAAKKMGKSIGDDDLSKLEKDLQKAIDDENYELAAKLRDEINDRKR